MKIKSKRRGKMKKTPKELVMGKPEEITWFSE